MYNGRLVKGWRAAQSFCRVCPNVGEVHFFLVKPYHPPTSASCEGLLVCRLMCLLALLCLMHGGLVHSL